MTTDIEGSISRYMTRYMLGKWHPRAALIDMDGVLYDSMPRHARAWKKMMEHYGVSCTEDEFFLYEGMTGLATIRLLAKERMDHIPDDAEAKEMYALKANFFLEQGERRCMPDADKMLHILQDAGIKRVLVTGSAQQNLLESLSADYPGAFHKDMRVTALDVTKGKPDPEPYLMGLKKAGTTQLETIVIENAPLGVEAGHAAGCFTIGITTGPIPHESLAEAGADFVANSMKDFVSVLPDILKGNG